VLDFVGHHRKEFRFDRRFRALLGGSRNELVEQIQGHFPFLPAGCQLELDPVASKIVLDNVRAAVPSQWAAKARELSELARGKATGDVGLGEFLEDSGVELEDVYRGSRSWSDLREEAGLPTAPAGPHERILWRACGRLLHVDDAMRLDAYRAFLRAPTAPALDALDERSRRLQRMLVASVTDSVATKETTLAQGAELLWGHAQLRAELLALLDVLAHRIDHLHTPHPRPEVPLQIHARYTRLEILGAYGIGEGAKIAPWQTGVYWDSDAATDLFAFTLDKTSGQFSPTTRYRDGRLPPHELRWGGLRRYAADDRPPSTRWARSRRRHEGTGG
jgi:hypothetical protein